MCSESETAPVSFIHEENDPLGAYFLRPYLFKTSKLNVPLIYFSILVLFLKEKKKRSPQSFYLTLPTPTSPHLPWHSKQKQDLFKKLGFKNGSLTCQKNTFYQNISIRKFHLRLIFYIPSLVQTSDSLWNHFIYHNWVNYS